MVWGLAWRCCIKRSVKKRSNSGARLILVFTADPPTDAPDESSPLASIPANRADTSTCQQLLHGRDRLTGWANGARHPHHCDTSATTSAGQVGDENRGDAVRACRRGRANQSAGTGY